MISLHAARYTLNAAHARLWAEEAIARNNQRLIQTAAKLRFFDDGARELAELRKTPMDHELDRQRVNVLRGLAGMPDLPRAADLPVRNLPFQSKPKRVAKEKGEEKGPGSGV